MGMVNLFEEMAKAESELAEGLSLLLEQSSAVEETIADLLEQLLRLQGDLGSIFLFFIPYHPQMESIGEETEITERDNQAAPSVLAMVNALIPVTLTALFEHLEKRVAFPSITIGPPRSILPSLYREYESIEQNLAILHTMVEHLQSSSTLNYLFEDEKYAVGQRLGDNLTLPTESGPVYYAALAREGDLSAFPAVQPVLSLLRQTTEWLEPLSPASHGTFPDTSSITPIIPEETAIPHSVQGTQPSPTYFFQEMISRNLTILEKIIPVVQAREVPPLPPLLGGDQDVPGEPSDTGSSLISTVMNSVTQFQNSITPLYLAALIPEKTTEMPEAGTSDLLVSRGHQDRLDSFQTTSSIENFQGTEKANLHSHFEITPFIPRIPRINLIPIEEEGLLPPSLSEGRVGLQLVRQQGTPPSQQSNDQTLPAAVQAIRASTLISSRIFDQVKSQFIPMLEWSGGAVSPNFLFGTTVGLPHDNLAETPLLSFSTNTTLDIGAQGGQNRMPVILPHILASAITPLHQILPRLLLYDRDTSSPAFSVSGFPPTVSSKGRMVPIQEHIPLNLQKTLITIQQASHQVENVPPLLQTLGQGRIPLMKSTIPVTTFPQLPVAHSDTAYQPSPISQQSKNEINFHNTFHIEINMQGKGDERDLRELGQRIGTILTEELKRYGGTTWR